MNNLLQTPMITLVGIRYGWFEIRHIPKARAVNFQEELMEQMHLQDQYLEFVRAMWNAGWASDARQVAVNQPEAKPENTLTLETTSGEILKTA
jgi:hypothetical protein